MYSEDFGDGGTAFPCSADDRRNPGMSLLDYFAAQALAGGLGQGEGAQVETGGPCYWSIPPTQIAKRAYEIAEAMLAYRD